MSDDNDSDNNDDNNNKKNNKNNKNKNNTVHIFHDQQRTILDSHPWSRPHITVYLNTRMINI
jgi:hypothetical protein